MYGDFDIDGESDAWGLLAVPESSILKYPLFVR
jgi:hypothetical protein